MLRLQVVIEKNRIVSSRLQKLFGVGNFANDVKVIALEAFREPVAAPLVILSKKMRIGWRSPWLLVNPSLVVNREKKPILNRKSLLFVN